MNSSSPEPVSKFFTPCEPKYPYRPVEPDDAWADPTGCLSDRAMKRLVVLAVVPVIMLFFVLCTAASVALIRWAF